MNVAIVGVTGYSGTVLWRLLNQHPNIQRVNIYTQQSDLTAVSKQFNWVSDQSINVFKFDVADIMTNNDAVFFATPAGVTGGYAAELMNNDFPVIDLSGDLRLKDPAQYKKWYHQEPNVSHETLSKVTYGLTEFTASTATYIANPGCYATATLMGLAPLVQERLIDLN